MASTTVLSANANSTSPSLPAAHEVLRLLTYALDMLTRHQDGMTKLMASCEREEIAVVNHLGNELIGLWEQAKMVNPSFVSTVSTLQPEPEQTRHGKKDEVLDVSAPLIEAA